MCASMTPFIINRICRFGPNIIGVVISMAGSFALFAFHATESLVSVNLAPSAPDLSLTMTAGMSVVVSSSPREFLGIRVGVGVVFTWMSIGPPVAGVYMEDCKLFRGIDGNYPPQASYNWVFPTSCLLSVASVELALVLRQRARREKDVWA